MPTVAQVEAKVRGTDPDDTLARQGVALRVLYGVFMETGAGGFGQPASPAEKKLADAYMTESTRLLALAPKAAKKRYWQDSTPISSDFHDEILELFGLDTAVAEARANADGLSAAARARAGSADASLAELLPFIGIMAFGGLMVIGGFSGMVKTKHRERELRREAFERRNAAGVLEFRNFEEAEAFRLQRPQNNMAGCIAVLITLIGLFFVVVGGAVLYAKLTHWHF